MKKSPHLKTEEASPVGTPKSITSTGANVGTPPDGLSPGPDAEALASPFKRHRASMPGLNNSFGSLDSTPNEAQLPATSMSDAPPSDAQQRAASTPEVKRDVPPPETLDEEL